MPICFHLWILSNNQQLTVIISVMSQYIDPALQGIKFSYLENAFKFWAARAKKRFQKQIWLRQQCWTQGHVGQALDRRGGGRGGSDFGGASSLPAWEQCDGYFSAERNWKCSEHREHTPGVCLCLSLSLICQCTWFYACWCTSVFLCWLRLWVMLRYLFVSLLVNILELCTPACVEMKFLHSVDTVLPRQE